MTGRSATAAVVAGAAILAACVGPATTAASYRGKALRAANDALSQAETVALTTRELLAGRVLVRYADVVFSTSENSLTSIQGSFDSIQPPNNDNSDKQRDALDQALTAAASAAADIRIASRRDDTAQLSTTAQTLDQAIAGLNSFIKDAAR
jgi:hypothetical protein